MKFPHHPPRPLSCNVVVQDNEFLATVRLFGVSPSGCRPITLGSLKPGETIRLKIEPIPGGPVTVRLAVVEWVKGNHLGVRIDLIYPEDEQKLTEVAWVSGKRTAQPHWLRRLLGGEDQFHRVYLSYAPHLREDRARLSQVA